MPLKPQPAKARIYVIGALKHLESVTVGERSWWCIEKSAVEGEIGVLYIKGQGMALVFRLIAHATPQTLCKDFGLSTGEIEVLAKIAKPIHASVLRAHPVLRRLPALARSFQSKSFRLEEPFTTTLTGLLGYTAAAPAKI